MEYKKVLVIGLDCAVPDLVLNRWGVSIILDTLDEDIPANIGGKVIR